jgi:hypothetical protein
MAEVLQFFEDCALILSAEWIEVHRLNRAVDGAPRALIPLHALPILKVSVSNGNGA